MTKSKDYVRICQCGNRWYLPKEYATESLPGRSQLGANKFGSRIGNAKQRTAAALNQANAQAQRDRYLSNATCGACGRSDTFKQYKAGKEPQGASVAPVAASPAPVAADWLADPTGRFALRYWSGSAWTEHVSNGAGHQATNSPT